MNIQNIHKYYNEKRNIDITAICESITIGDICVGIIIQEKRIGFPPSHTKMNQQISNFISCVTYTKLYDLFQLQTFKFCKLQSICNFREGVLLTGSIINKSLIFGWFCSYVGFCFVTIRMLFSKTASKKKKCIQVMLMGGWISRFNGFRENFMLSQSGLSNFSLI